jgi:hypothetical protein
MVMIERASNNNKQQNKNSVVLIKVVSIFYLVNIATFCGLLA